MVEAENRTGRGLLLSKLEREILHTLAWGSTDMMDILASVELTSSTPLLE